MCVLSIHMCVVGAREQPSSIALRHALRGGGASMGTSPYSHAVFRFLKMSCQQRRVRGEDGSRAPVQSLHCWTRRSATDNGGCTKNRKRIQEKPSCE
jgi:hypothetical protein